MLVEITERAMAHVGSKEVGVKCSQNPPSRRQCDVACCICEVVCFVLFCKGFGAA